MSEERLVDANLLSDSIQAMYRTQEQISSIVIDEHLILLAIENASTVDAVEVVRCGECEFSDDCICVVCEDGKSVVCKKMGCHVEKSHYCSYGKRRESEDA